MPTRFTPDDVRTWYRSTTGEIFLGDVLDETNSDTMGAGFARYAPAEANKWLVTYDEVLVITAGSFTVTSGAQAATAGPGELLFLRNGTELVYSAGPAGADLVYVSYPQWAKAQRDSSHHALLDTFQPAGADVVQTNNLALTRAVWQPLERHETADLQPFFNTLHDNVVLETSAGTLHGKATVIAYFGIASETVDFDPFIRPLDYYGAGNRVAIAGDETFTVKATGATHQAPWVWLLDLRDGLVHHITSIQDLSGIAPEIRTAIAKATTASTG